MNRPADLPSSAHFQQLPCGTRAKYVAGGCHCMLCRAANSRYECERAAARKRGEGNGLVSAARAQAHLRWLLSKHGVGRRAVRAASDVGETTLQEIRSGRKTKIRAQTERRILAVDRLCVSDHALVPARRAWALLKRLKADGYPALRLVRFLGGKSSGLQFGRVMMTARNVRRVERLYRELMAEEVTQA
jgi:hypothetical protein